MSWGDKNISDFFFKHFPVFPKSSIMSMYYFLNGTKIHCYHIPMKNNLYYLIAHGGVGG